MAQRRDHVEAKWHADRAVPGGAYRTMVARSIRCGDFSERDRSATEALGNADERAGHAGARSRCRARRPQVDPAWIALQRLWRNIGMNDPGTPTDAMKGSAQSTSWTN